MRTTYSIATNIEGTLDEITAAPAPTDVPTLEQVLASLQDLAFIVETVAHLQGKERELIPTADNARRIIAALQPKPR